jgi:hypothetical protein
MACASQMNLKHQMVFGELAKSIIEFQDKNSARFI